MGKAEAIVEGYLQLKAESCGFFCAKTVSPSRTGFPDRVLIGYGVTVFVETKAVSGRLRETQKTTIRSMLDHGALVHVPKTRAQVDRILRFYSTPQPAGAKLELIPGDRSASATALELNVPKLSDWSGKICR